MGTFAEEYILTTMWDFCRKTFAEADILSAHGGTFAEFELIHLLLYKTNVMK